MKRLALDITWSNSNRCLTGKDTGQWLTQSIRQDGAQLRGSIRSPLIAQPHPGSQALPPHLPQNSRPCTAKMGGGQRRHCSHPHRRLLRLCPGKWNKGCCPFAPSLWSHACDQTWKKTMASRSESNTEPGPCWEIGTGCALCSGVRKHRLGREGTSKESSPSPTKLDFFTNIYLVAHLWLKLPESRDFGSLLRHIVNAQWTVME